MNEQSQAAGVSWLESLLSFQGLEATVSPQLVEDAAGSSCWLVIDETHLSQAQVEGLIGPRGATLDSMQYLANTLLNLGKDTDGQQAFTIELAGYRARRQAELEAIAAQAAEQAQATGKEFEIRDLSSAERRQVHHFLKIHEGLETFSRGREPDRRLVVRQAGLQEGHET
ncbi:R3H domain-containing nucleic acid-binding protein [Pseudanabaena sp. FACHB-2040]|uniref:Jag family protein n=1 Tax=Pseudanabaena sp. FACHB-2040 TaxID=2692859 RepID=UPI00168877C7|nr:R3H domain-containing nucleic acid-binding protein [Pseudanabaena sp. FACHB-2040]MBD2259787.1 RNA-binding protein [Pseudanabaena sp. FACHB-2040]